MEKISRSLFLEVGGGAAITTMVPKALLADTRGKILPLVIFFQGGRSESVRICFPTRRFVPGTPRRGHHHDRKERRTSGRSLETIRETFGQDRGDPVFGCTKYEPRCEVCDGPTCDLCRDACFRRTPHPFIEEPSTFSDRSQLDAKLGMHITWDATEKQFKAPELKIEPGLSEK